MTTELNLSARFVIKNEHGIHARPGAHFVAALKPYRCTVKIANLARSNNYVNAKSLMALMSLGIKKGHEVNILFHGEDAQSALQKIHCEIENGLGE
ncbi:HPr family phosphocarrier protein [Salmonella enterica]|nr:HPr family phosphocarrier protein [Salmonella enterica]